MITTIIDNSGIADRFEHKKRATELARESRPDVNKLKPVRVNKTTVILVNRKLSKSEIDIKIKQLNDKWNDKSYW